MKILIVKTLAGGVSKNSTFYNMQEIGLAKALVRSGHQCDIVFYDSVEYESTIEVDGGIGVVTVFYKTGIRIRDSIIYKGLNSLASRYDVVHASEYERIQSWILARNFPDKTIIYHGPYKSDVSFGTRVRHWIADHLFKPAYLRNRTPFLAKTDYAREFLLQKGIKGSNVKVVGVGLDPEPLLSDSSNSSKDEFLSENTSHTERIILYIGRLEPRRNPLFLVKVYKEVVKKHPDARLYIVGKEPEKYEGAFMDDPEMKALIEEGEIEYWDSLPQRSLPDLYAKCDVFLLPTSYEIFGMVLLEAMFFGAPVITTRNGGSVSLIEDGKDGIVIDELNVRAWAESVSCMLSNEEKRLGISVAAREKILHGFLWDKLAPSFIDAYSSMKKGDEALGECVVKTGGQWSSPTRTVGGVQTGKDE